MPVFNVQPSGIIESILPILGLAGVGPLAPGEVLTYGREYLVQIGLDCDSWDMMTREQRMESVRNFESGPNGRPTRNPETHIAHQMDVVDRYCQTTKAARMAAQRIGSGGFDTTEANSRIRAAFIAQNPPTHVLSALNLTCDEWLGMLRVDSMQKLTDHFAGQLWGWGVPPIAALWQAITDHCLRVRVAQVRAQDIAPGAFAPVSGGGQFAPKFKSTGAINPSGLPSAAGVLNTIGMNCRDWQHLSPSQRSLMVRSAYAAFSASESDVLSIVQNVNQYCEYRDVVAPGAFAPVFANQSQFAPKKSAGAITTASALPWVGGAILGSLVTYAVCSNKKR